MSNKDPFDNLIDYIGTVKPYHTKIYEVILRYAYGEGLSGSIGESYEIQVTMETPDDHEWLICEGVGWDTQPFDIGLFDFPSECEFVSPSTVKAYITEDLKFETEMFLGDPLFGYVQDNTEPAGWDETAWDYTQFDSYETENPFTITDTP